MQSAHPQWFDEAYYQRYYFDKKTSVADPEHVQRLGAFVCSYLQYLRVPVRRVLDVGCGGGILSESMARRGAEVLGIDMGAAPLAVGTLHAEQMGVKSVAYRQVTVEALAAEQPESFDTVTCLEMLEHVPDPSQVVAACAQLVKPDGWVFFSTLNRSPKSFLFAVVGAEYVLNLLPRGTHEYAKMIRPSELAAYCRQAGLELRHTRGMDYNPITRRYAMVQSTAVNYLFATQKVA